MLKSWRAEVNHETSCLFSLSRMYAGVHAYTLHWHNDQCNTQGLNQCTVCVLHVQWKCVVCISGRNSDTYQSLGGKTTMSALGIMVTHLPTLGIEPVVQWWKASALPAELTRVRSSYLKVLLTWWNGNWKLYLINVKLDVCDFESLINIPGSRIPAPCGKTNWGGEWATASLSGSVNKVSNLLQMKCSGTSLYSFC